jgi:UDP-N-acetylmuramoyl-L-alanyl-D-glutamate--2,6-diaminopimelate ligase
MMRLAELAAGIVPFPESAGRIPIADITADSRRAAPGCLFAAVPGFRQDGRRFIGEALSRGASAVITEDEVDGIAVPVLTVPNVRRSLSLLAKRFFGNPSDSMLVAGVTGTNGKTTVAFLLESVLKHAGFETGLLGTIAYRWKSYEEPAGRTTPDSVDVHRMLRGMADAGVCAVSMEVSSHALALERVAGIRFRSAVFTNLTRDHLDFHGTLQEYGRVKSLLFGMLDSGGTAVVNADDPAAGVMLAAAAGKTATYGITAANPDYRIEDIRTEAGLTRFSLSRGGKSFPFVTPLWGRFNTANTAAAAVAGLELGLDPESVRRGIAAMERVPGRMEGFTSKSGIRVVVDYAHTPDALENVLAAVREFTPGRILTVFGCGGDRDRGKRPQMGRIASSRSDLTFATSDNPRSEDPMAILRDILDGVGDKARVKVLADRAEAIRAALAAAEPGDTVLLAGKGHETYQETGGVRQPFDDRAAAEAFFMEHGDL